MASLYFEQCSAYILRFRNGLVVVLVKWHADELHLSQSFKRQQSLVWPCPVLIFRMRMKNNDIFFRLSCSQY